MACGTPGTRPFRATVYLPGHDEQGQGVVVGKASAATPEALEATLARHGWDTGYAVTRYEVLELELETGG